MSAEKNTDTKRAYKVNPCGSWCEFADNNWQIREGWSLRSVARLLRTSLSTKMVQSIIHISKQVPGRVRQQPFVVTSPSHSRTTQCAHVLSFLFRSKGGKGVWTRGLEEPPELQRHHSSMMQLGAMQCPTSATGPSEAGISTAQNSSKACSHKLLAVIISDRSPWYSELGAERGLI